MEVMNFLNFIKAQNVLKTLKNIHLFWSSFHKNWHALSEYRYSSENTDHSKNHSGDWVCDTGLREKEDYKCCNHYTNTLNDVSNYMDYSSSNIHIFMVMASMISTFWCSSLVSIFLMIMIMLFLYKI